MAIRLCICLFYVCYLRAPAVLGKQVLFSAAFVRVSDCPRTNGKKLLIRNQSNLVEICVITDYISVILDL